MHLLGILKAKLASFSRAALEQLYTPAVSIAGYGEQQEHGNL
jgi:hypothetical protein